MKVRRQIAAGFHLLLSEKSEAFAEEAFFCRFVSAKPLNDNRTHAERSHRKYSRILDQTAPSFAVPAKLESKKGEQPTMKVKTNVKAGQSLWGA